MNITQHLRNEVLKTESHVPLSGVTAYHLLEGSLALASTTITAGFATTLYTGNGSTQSITTGVDMATQWGNSATETYGGLVWFKSRSAVGSNILFNTVVGVNNYVASDTTNAQLNATFGSFTSSGLNLGNWVGTNTNATTYASWVFQTTHRITGTTNHGKAYTCHYNPYTGFTIVKYEGSGIAGHEIPHHLGRKLGFATVKITSSTGDWYAQYNETSTLYLNLTNASAAASNAITAFNDNSVTTGTIAGMNGSGATHILYGWANSYFDEANTLIGNYEVGVYQGTGASGNKVATRGKPAWVMIKRLDSTGNWILIDNLRADGYVAPNLSNAEATTDLFDINSDSFTLKSSDSNTNASGSQYLYMVVYDNDSGSGKSKYPKPSDTANLNINNAVIPFANGLDANGSLVSILSKNETISGLTLQEGKNYVYLKSDGTYGTTKFAPNYGTYNGFGEYFDIATNKWYNSPSVFSDSFSTDTGWTAISSTKVVANGSVTITNTTTAQGYITKTFTTVIGKQYAIVGTNSIGSSTTQLVQVGTSAHLLNQTLSSSGVFKFTFTSDGTSIPVYLANGSTTSGQTGTFGEVAIFPINNDGSVDLSSATPTTNGRNYLNAIVYADQNGQPTYVEQLPKTQYFDEVKANEYKGKNACTAWVNFDGTTTPPTIRDSYNVSAVIRTSTGVYDIYFSKPMDNINYTTLPNSNSAVSNHLQGTVNKSTIQTFTSAFAASNVANIEVQIFGGKNV